MNFTYDSPIEIHVHGHDLEREVEPGERTELTFEATGAAPAGSKPPGFGVAGEPKSERSRKTNRHRRRAFLQAMVLHEQ
jgi:hypothetical protein